jgi:hypothetical protein
MRCVYYFSATQIIKIHLFRKALAPIPLLLLKSRKESTNKLTQVPTSPKEPTSPQEVVANLAVMVFLQLLPLWRVWERIQPQLQ